MLQLMTQILVKCESSSCKTQTRHLASVSALLFGSFQLIQFHTNSEASMVARHSHSKVALMVSNSFRLDHSHFFFSWIQPTSNDFWCEPFVICSFSPSCELNCKALRECLLETWSSNIYRFIIILFDIFLIMTDVWSMIMLWIFSYSSRSLLREGLQKWKSEMAFAVKGVGRSRAPLRYFEKKMFKNHLESLPNCQNVLYCIWVCFDWVYTV